MRNGASVWKDNFLQSSVRTNLNFSIPQAAMLLLCRLSGTYEWNQKLYRKPRDLDTYSTHRAALTLVRRGLVQAVCEKKGGRQKPAASQIFEDPAKTWQLTDGGRKIASFLESVGMFNRKTPPRRRKTS